MAAKKLVRDLVLLGHPLRLHLSSQPQAWSSRLRLITAGGHLCNRRYSVFNEFSKKVKGEASSKSVKQLKEKAEELHGVKEELKFRTKQTAEQLYMHVRGVWTEANATTKKVSAIVKEKISSAAEEVKGQFGIRKQEESASASGSTKHDSHAKDGNDGKSTEEKCKRDGSGDNTESFFGKHRASFFSSSPKASSIFQKLKGVKVFELPKKGYDTVGEELSGSSIKRKHMDRAPTTSTVERSARTDVDIPPSMQCMWEAAEEKKLKGLKFFVLPEWSGDPSERKHMDRAPTTSTVKRSTQTDVDTRPSMKCLFEASKKEVSWPSPNLKGVKIVDMVKDGYDTVMDELSGGCCKRKHMDHASATSTVERSTRTDVVTLPCMQCLWEESKEKFVENVRERWASSDNTVLHEIECPNGTVFQETEATASMEEIRWRDAYDIDSLKSRE